MTRERMKEERLRINRTIGKNISRERKQRGLSMDELSQILDLTPSHLHMIERGERGANPVVLERLAKSLSIPYVNLFSEGIKTPDINGEEAERELYNQQILALISTMESTALDVTLSAVKGILRLCNTRKVSE